jgi:hypothetical protein
VRCRRVGRRRLRIGCGLGVTRRGRAGQLWRQLADQCLDLACELSFLGLQLQDASSDRAQGEQAAAKLRPRRDTDRVTASHDKNSQLEALRPGLTDDVTDPAAVPDTMNEGALKMFHERQDYTPKHPAPGKKGA